MRPRAPRFFLQFHRSSPGGIPPSMISCMGSFRLRPEVADYRVDFHSTHGARVAARLQHAGALQAARDVPGFAVHDGRVATGAEADDALRVHGRAVRDLLPADAHDGARDRFDVVAAARAHARRLILRTRRVVRRRRRRAALEILLPRWQRRFGRNQLDNGQVVGRLAVQTLTNPPRAVFEFEPRNAVLDTEARGRRERFQRLRSGLRRRARARARARRWLETRVGRAPVRGGC